MATTTKKTKAPRTKKSESPLLRLIVTFDNLCHGKTVGKVSRIRFISTLVDMYTSDLDQQVENSCNALKVALLKDVQLPKIKRSFPSFQSSPEIMGVIRSNYSRLQGLFLSILYLTNMHLDEDLIENVIGLAQSMESLIWARKVSTCLKLINAGKKVLPEHFVALQSLQSIANQYSLSGTLQSLPEATVSLVDSSSAYKAIVAGINKFPVAEELSELLKTSRTRIVFHLNEIQDIFRDYSIGDIRSKALTEFPTLCNKYIEQ